MLRFAVPAGLAALARASFCDEAGWSQLWADEFDVEVLDNASWNVPVHVPGGSDTREASAVAENVWVQDGALVIKSSGVWDGAAWTNLTSGAMQSNGKRSFQASGRAGP